MPKVNEKLQKKSSVLSYVCKYVSHKIYDKKEVLMISTIHTEIFVDIPNYLVYTIIIN